MEVNDVKKLDIEDEEDGKDLSVTLDSASGLRDITTFAVYVFQPGDTAIIKNVSRVPTGATYPNTQDTTIKFKEDIDVKCETDKKFKRKHLFCMPRG